MMTLLFAVISMLIVHFIADFILQPRWMGKGKSKDIRILLAHVCIYTSMFLLLGVSYIYHKDQVDGLFLFGGITFVCHFITDYFSSRLGSKLWAQGKEYESLLVLGADQLLHALQLILTYWFLSR